MPNCLKITGCVVMEATLAGTKNINYLEYRQYNLKTYHVGIPFVCPDRSTKLVTVLRLFARERMNYFHSWTFVVCSSVHSVMVKEFLISS